MNRRGGPSQDQLELEFDPVGRAREAYAQARAAMARAYHGVRKLREANLRSAFNDLLRAEMTGPPQGGA